MNATFLLTLAAHRQDQQAWNGALPTSSRADGSNHDNCSGTIVVTIPALIDQLGQRRSPLNQTASIRSGDASGIRQPFSASAALSEPPVAARPQCATAAANTIPLDNDAESSGSSLCLAQECRICLSADSSNDLVRPCNCCGTLGYTHMSCLAAWVEERGSLICELCGERYKQPYVQLLEPLAAAAMQRHKQRFTNASISIAAPWPPHQMSRGEWCVLLFSLFLLIMAFFIVSVTVSRRQG